MRKNFATDAVYAVLTALINRRFLMVSILIAVIPFVIYGAKNTWGHTENKVEDWVPKDFPETKQLLEFGNIFDANEIFFVSWDDCTLDSPKVQEFKEKLIAPQKASDGTEHIFFSDVITGQDVYKLLSDESLDLDHEEILERMKGFLISDDYNKTCLIVFLSVEGRKYRPDAIGCVWTIAQSIGLDMKTFHAAGPSIDSVAIDSICRKYLIEMNLASYMIGIFISYLCFRSWRAAWIVFLVSFFNQQMCVAIIYWFHFQFDSILLLAINLSFVLSMSAGIHLTNYYRDAITRLEPREAMFSALKTALVPTFISVITTIAGLLSFLNSQLVPIRQFGSVASIALAISVSVILIYLPIYYISHPIKSWQNVTKKDSKWDMATIIENLFYPWVSRIPYVVLLISLVIAGVCFYGASKIKTSIGLYSMLRSYTQPIRDYTWVEKEFGPLIPVEVMFTWDQGTNENIYDRLCFVRDVTQQLKDEMKDVSIISITNFIPEIPTSGARAVAARRLFNRKIDVAKEGFAKSGYFKELDNKQYWRITIRTYAMRRIDYGPIIQQIKDIVESNIEIAKKKALAAPAVQTALSDIPKTIIDQSVCISTTVSGETAAEKQPNKDPFMIKQKIQETEQSVKDTMVNIHNAVQTVGQGIDKLYNALKPEEQTDNSSNTQNAEALPMADQKVAEQKAAEQNVAEQNTANTSELPNNDGIVVDSAADAIIPVDPGLDATITVDPAADAAIIPVDPAADAVIPVDPGLDEVPGTTPVAPEAADKQVSSSSTTQNAPMAIPDFMVTGGVPVVYKAQNQLLDDLKISFLTAFVIIGLILVCLFRSFRCGILAVFPSLLPVIFVFGIVGWMGLRVEMGTMLTGSAALGIAVDNTVHFITWYRIGYQRGLSRKDATRLAYRKCGSAMFQTSSVCSLGLVMNMLSPFIPTIYFSFFMFALLFSALFSDLTVLPAILFSSWGKIFLRSVKKPENDAVESTPENA